MHRFTAGLFVGHCANTAKSPVGPEANAGTAPTSAIVSAAPTASAQRRRPVNRFKPSLVILLLDSLEYRSTYRNEATDRLAGSQGMFLISGEFVSRHSLFPCNLRLSGRSSAANYGSPTRPSRRCEQRSTRSRDTPEAPQCDLCEAELPQQFGKRRTRIEAQVIRTWIEVRGKRAP